MLLLSLVLQRLLLRCPLPIYWPIISCHWKTDDVCFCCHYCVQIQYTICDEAPQLATYAFLPVVQKFSEAFGINVAAPDISLAGRIIANFPDNLTEDQKMEDELVNLICQVCYDRVQLCCCCDSLLLFDA